jgi:inorganic triphosphatase YgiF
MPIEVEARFRATGPTPLARLANISTLADGAAEFGAAITFEEVDTYLDTAAATLAAARWACRLRARDGRVTVSLKGPAETPPSVGGVHRRPEVEGPATASHDPGDWPASPARDLVERLRQGAPLVERLALHQVRTERRVTLDGSTLAVLSLDAVSVHHVGGVRGTFHVVELELSSESGGREAELAELARRIAAEPGLAPDRLSKLERALEIVDAR